MAALFLAIYALVWGVRPFGAFGQREGRHQLLADDARESTLALARTGLRKLSDLPHLSDQGRYRVLVDVGLQTGSALRCLAQWDETLVLLALEAFPPNFKLSKRNTLYGGGREITIVDVKRNFAPQQVC
jgi:hypothetical protein